MTEGGRESHGVAGGRVLAAQAERLLRHRAGTCEGSDPEELHDMRVASRRLRAAVRAFGDAIPPKRRERLRKELRWLGRRLGGVRDLDVLLRRFEAGGAGLAPLRAALEREREKARARMVRALESRRFARLLLEIGKASRGEGRAPAAARAPAGEKAAPAAREAARRLVLKGDAALADPTPERLHRTRIRGKRLRYLLEFHRERFGPGGRKLVKRLVALQDLLGAHQDAVVAAAAVARVLDADEAPAPLAARLARERREAASLAKRWPALWKAIRPSLESIVTKKGDAGFGVP